MNERLSIGLWNVEWASRTDRGGFFVPRLAELSCDVLCVTEGSADLFPEFGHVIPSDADYGYSLKAGRRKVLLWSRAPWSDVDTLGSPLLPPGRFVAGTTSTTLGAIRFIGVCVPWRDAHVRSGHRNRRPWDDHLAYGLTSLLRQLDPASPVVLLGDFNQRIPRVQQPKHVFDTLIDALGPDFRLAIAGTIVNASNPSIDHLAVCGPLVSVSTEFRKIDTRSWCRRWVARHLVSGHEGILERFVVKRNETAFEDLLSEEDAAGMSLSGELGTLLTFDEALRTLGRYPWHRFYPLHCIPTSLMRSSKKSQHWVVRSRQSVGNKFSFVKRVLNRRDHPRSQTRSCSRPSSTCICWHDFRLHSH